MEVGEESVDGFYLSWGVDEDIGGTGGGLGVVGLGLGEVLKNAGDGGADGDGTTGCFAETLGGLVRETEALGVHVMVGDEFAFDGAEGAYSYVKGEEVVGNFF